MTKYQANCITQEGKNVTLIVKEKNTESAMAKLNNTYKVTVKIIEKYDRLSASFKLIEGDLDKANIYYKENKKLYG